MSTRRPSLECSSRLRLRKPRRQPRRSAFGRRRLLPRSSGYAALAAAAAAAAAAATLTATAAAAAMQVHIVAPCCLRQAYNTPQEETNFSCCVMQFTDIQGSLEAAPSTRSDDTTEEHPPGGTPLTRSPEASSAPPQREASQGSLGAALGDEQKKKSRREWQQSLRSSNKFKSADATRGRWGLSVHSPKTERRSAQLLYNSNNAVSPF